MERVRGRSRIGGEKKERDEERRLDLGQKWRIMLEKKRGEERMQREDLGGSSNLSPINIFWRAKSLPHIQISTFLSTNLSRPIKIVLSNHSSRSLMWCGPHDRKDKVRDVQLTIQLKTPSFYRVHVIQFSLTMGVWLGQG